jgi:multidrug efflux system membrane fusion protein
VRRTYALALAITGVIALWLLSGQIGRPATQRPPTLAELNAARAATTEDTPLTRVRARVVHAELQEAVVPLRGRTENKRTVTVRAETGGPIVERPIERGQRVTKGQLLCRISTEDRQAKLEEGREALNQARIEYEGSLKLQRQGLISETLSATTKARLATAEAQVEHATIEIARTRIRAPFDGLVETTNVEVGDFVQVGNACATVIDLDPMLLVGRVSERDVHKLRLDTVASGVLIDGTRVEGKLTFIGQQSDVSTRTYPVEIQVPNPDYALRSGVTTQISIPVETVLAHRISPALLALDDEGRVGVRTLDHDNRVVFNLVKIINDEGGSVWITGLPEVATLITVGQELVVPHQQVDVVIETPPEAPAATPPQSGEREVAGGPHVGARTTAPIVQTAVDARAS